jgi:hypothetical protein
MPPIPRALALPAMARANAAVAAKVTNLDPDRMMFSALRF